MGFLDVETGSIDLNLINFFLDFIDRDTGCTTTLYIYRDECLFIALLNSVYEFETVFHSLFFWQFLFIPQITPNEDNSQILVF